MKRILLTILMLVVLVSMITACGVSSGPASPTVAPAPPASGGAPATPAVQQPKEKVRLTFLCQINVDTEGYDVNDNPYINHIREANNLDIRIISESQNYTQVVNTIMASGDLPDYVQLNKSQMYQFAAAGLLMPLNDYLSKEKYPDLIAGTNPTFWDFATINGKISAIPFGRYDQTPFMSWAWKEWLDNLGIDPANLKTVDDYTELCRAFTEDDPNRSGKNDTYALYANNGGTSERNLGMLFMDAFGAGNHQFVDGELLPRYLTDEYKAYLKHLAMLYQRGYIVPDYITKAQNDAESEAFAGKAGIFNLFWSLSGRSKHREELVPLTPPMKLDGSGRASYVYDAPVRHYIAITTSCKHPERVLDLMNWAHTDEGATYVHAGVETFDYKMNNGNLEILPERVGKNWAWRFLTLGMQKSIVDNMLSPILEQSWGSLAISHLKLTEQFGTFDPVALASPEFPQLADYDLQSLVDEYRNKAVMNLVDIDATWDNYVQTWRRSGGNEWIRLYTDWYLKSYK